MSAEDQRIVMAACRAYQGYGEPTAEQIAWTENFQLPDKGPDTLWAEMQMDLSSMTKAAIREARTEMLMARERLAMLTTQAYPRHDYDAIAFAKQEAWRTEMVYIATRSALQAACVAAGFDSFQTRVWTLYYSGAEMDLVRLAQRMRTSARRIEYILHSVRMECKFCFGLGRLAECADIVD